MSRVLLLNATYEPIHVLSFKRAIALVVEDKAEIIEERDGTQIRSANLEVPYPSVIRLKYYVKIPYRAKIRFSKRAVFARDKNTCQYCGKPGNTIDHVYPRSRGGENTWENVVLACEKCNFKKGSKLLSELGWSLKTTPVAPEGTYWLVVGLKADPSWEPYLAKA